MSGVFSPILQPTTLAYGARASTSSARTVEWLMKPNPIPFALRYRRAWLCWAANGLRYLRPNGVAEL